MKQLNLLKTLFLLCALVVGSLNSWAEEVTFDFPTIAKAKSWTSGTAYTSITIDPITITALGGGNNGKWYSTGDGSWRMYSGGTVKITAADGYDVTAVSSNPSVSFTISGGEATFSPSGRTDFASITVTYSEAAPPVSVTGVSLDQTSLSLTAGDKATLTPTVSPAEATNKNVTWESDDEGVATVAGGVVTAVAAGTCTITVTTVDGGFSATCDVTVNAAPEPALTFDFGTNIFSLPVGSANKTVTAEDYTDGDYTINVEGSTGEGYYWHTDGYLLMGKSGAKLTFPAFDFNVSKIKIYGRSGASSKVTFNIFVSDVAVSEEATSSVEDHEFKIPADKQAAGTVYVLKVTNGNNCQITKVEFLGYIETPAVTAAGYATYVAPKNLEFAEGDAYRVKVDAGVAKLYPVTKVRKNVPVLLKGAGVKKPAVLEEAPAALASNDLKVSTGGDPADAYVLANKGGKVGFYKWNGGSLTSGKVYLYAPGLSAHEYIAFDGEESGDVTGINEVAADKTFNGEFFNLAGQRVAQPTKGLYIVNGKKVIIK